MVNTGPLDSNSNPFRGELIEMAPRPSIEDYQSRWDGSPLHLHSLDESKPKLTQDQFYEHKRNGDCFLDYGDFCDCRMVSCHEFNVDPTTSLCVPLE